MTTTCRTSGPTSTRPTTSSRPPPRTETTSTSARRALARVEHVFVLGIDPGLSRCGYGVVRQYGSDLTAMAGGVVTTEPELPLQERLRVLFTELRALVAETRPDAVVVERVFFQTN